MIIDKKTLRKTVLTYCKELYPKDFMNTVRNSLFDIVVYRNPYDMLIKIVYEEDNHLNYEVQKKVILENIEKYKTSFVTKKFYIAVLEKDLNIKGLFEVVPEE